VDAGDWSARIPQELVDRARQVARGSLPIALPRDAATVVLLRDRDSGLEAYLLRRVATMAFAAGMHVFPGGTVDPRDERLAERHWSGPSPEEWAGVLSASPALARALVCAAVRETFEESGVLLAGPTPARVVDDTTDESWEADRLALVAREQSFAEFLERRRLLLRADLLCPWSHWVTPEPEPRRYDTRFFVAALPSSQVTRSVRGEADRAAWWRPAAALDELRAGRISMMPPTAFTLLELSAWDHVADLLTAGRERNVRPVLPHILVGDAEEARLLLPGDEGYPAEP
jgi:8-oxo-dGTP pyrophosphatase MutT (NUDIX family)